MGRTNFVEQYHLRTSSESGYIENVLRSVQENDIELIRLSFADQHGILRGKSVVADELPQALRNGCTSTTTLLAKDTSHKTVFPVSPTPSNHRLKVSNDQIFPIPFLLSMSSCDCFIESTTS